MIENILDLFIRYVKNKVNNDEPTMTDYLDDGILYYLLFWLNHINYLYKYLR